MGKMKVWIGPELEGYDKGVLTMFVKAEKPNPEYLTDYFYDNPECKRLYLGAGRTDTKEFPIALFDFCDDNNITVVIETTPSGLKYIPEEIRESYQIILRFDAPEAANMLCGVDLLKVDTMDMVYICEVNNTIQTDLETLYGDSFEVDRIIFDGEAE